MPLRGGLRPSVTSAARDGVRWTGRDERMVVPVEQEDMDGLPGSVKETPQNKRVEYGQLQINGFWEAATTIVSVA